MGRMNIPKAVEEKVCGAVEHIYNTVEGDEERVRFSERNGINSLSILTVLSFSEASKITDYLMPHILGRTVVEVGAGVGWLALAMAEVAEYVYAVEADPAWSWVFTQHLYSFKPRNLTWIFGNAEDLNNRLRVPVGVVVTCSNVEGMVRIAKRLADEVYLVQPGKFDEHGRFSKTWRVQRK